ncbi:MAG: hypothetical protein LBB74_08455 [Chitinispirillales bacterium]|jgi:cell division protein FtsB/DNA-binding transcriptional ArsR family regulator|nr:hypothetical protein [Chitinispirillales bacterium]
MDAKGRKVLTGLTRLGGEQEVFDLSIAVKMTEEAVLALLKALNDEGLVSCRRDDGGKEFWSVADAKAAAPTGSGAKDSGSAAAAGKKRGKATAAGPDDRFDEFVLDPKAASPAPAPAPIPSAEADSFEPAPSAPAVKDATAAEEAEFEPIPPKAENRAKGGADAEFEPKPDKEKTARPSKKKAAGPDGDPSEPKPAKESRAEREFSAGPDDHFDEFAERVPSKPNLPIPLMAGAAVLILIMILFIVGGGGGKTKKNIKTAVEDVKTEFASKLDSLGTATAAEIDKLRAENKAFRDEINALKAESRKAAALDAAAKKGAADKPKPPVKKR